MVKAPKYLPSRWFLNGLLESDAQVSSCRLVSRPHMNTQPLRLFFSCSARDTRLLLSSPLPLARTVDHTGRCFFRDRAKLTLVAILSAIQLESSWDWENSTFKVRFKLQCRKSSSCLCIALGLKFGHHGLRPQPGAKEYEYYDCVLVRWSLRLKNTDYIKTYHETFLSFPFLKAVA